VATAVDPNWALEGLKIVQGLLGALVGGGLVILGGWLADRRKLRTEQLVRQQREKALLTGMFAVRNHIAQRLIEYGPEGRLSQLEGLRTAQSYVHRLIDKAPSESESLMIVVIEIGLTIDALIATMDRSHTDPGLKDTTTLAEVITREVKELAASLEQFDIVTGSQLTFLSEEDLAAFPSYAPGERDS